MTTKIKSDKDETRTNLHDQGLLPVQTLCESQSIIVKR